MIIHVNRRVTRKLPVGEISDGEECPSTLQLISLDVMWARLGLPRLIEIIAVFVDLNERQVRKHVPTGREAISGAFVFHVRVISMEAIHSVVEAAIEGGIVMTTPDAHNEQLCTAQTGRLTYHFSIVSVTHGTAITPKTPPTRNAAWNILTVPPWWWK